ncbi:helix-turn-helix domain-containing protein [Pimelobacter simplex]|uniref:helix-turn-helix domain-containing protein n=1 Tax=Nocardioides simplex TaxID=2045 RepID=UPI0035AFD3C9
MFRMGYCPDMGQKEQAGRAVNLRALELIRDAFDKSSGVTQQMLAEDSGIPRSTLANLLSRTSEPRLVHVEQLVRIAMALGKDPRAWISELQGVAAKERGREERDLKLRTTAGRALSQREGTRTPRGGAPRS